MDRRGETDHCIGGVKRDQSDHGDLAGAWHYAGPVLLVAGPAPEGGYAGVDEWTSGDRGGPSRAKSQSCSSSLASSRMAIEPLKNRRPSRDTVRLVEALREVRCSMMDAYRLIG